MVRVFLESELIACFRCCRDQTINIRSVCFDTFQRGCKEINFTNTHGVKPDTGSIIVSDREQAEKLFSKAFTIFAGTPGNPQDRGGKQSQNQQIADIEKYAHGIPFPSGNDQMNSRVKGQVSQLARALRQQFLYFLPLPQGQGSFRPTRSLRFRIVSTFCSPRLPSIACSCC